MASKLENESLKLEVTSEHGYLFRLTLKVDSFVGTTLVLILIERGKILFFEISSKMTLMCFCSNGVTYIMKISCKFFILVPISIILFASERAALGLKTYVYVSSETLPVILYSFDQF